MKLELKRLARERPLVLLVLLGAASTYVLLIGNLYRGETVQRIPVAVCDLEDSALSRELIRAVADADQLSYRATLNDDLAAVTALERGDAAGVLIVPPDFSTRFYSGQSIELALMLDGSNVLQASYALTPLQSVVSEFATKMLRQSMMSAGITRISTVAMSLRMVGNPTQSYLEFYLYGVMLVAAQVGIMTAFALSIFDGKKNSPPFKTVATKVILYLSLSVFSVMTAIVLMTAVFDLPLRAEPSKILLMCATFLFAVEGIAGVAAMLLKTRLSLVQCVVFYTLPAFLTSGYIWPEHGMTPPIRLLSMIQPVHYVLSDFRAMALTGASQHYFDHVTLFLLIGLCAMAIVWLPGSRREQRVGGWDQK